MSMSARPQEHTENSGESGVPGHLYNAGNEKSSYQQSHSSQVSPQDSTTQEQMSFICLKRQKVRAVLKLKKKT